MLGLVLLGCRSPERLLIADLSDPGALRAVAGCDVVFGCTDGFDGRGCLNRLATFYPLPTTPP